MKKEQDKNNATIDFVESLAKIAKQLDISEIDFKQNNLNIKISRGLIAQPSQYIQSSPAPMAQAPIVNPTSPSKDTSAVVKEEADDANNPNAILSPMVGVIYTSPNPESKPFVSVGDNVKKGDTLILIEAMKVFNPIKSPKDGKVVKILVSSNQAVEFNQPLIVVE